MRISDWSSDVCSSDLVHYYLVGKVAQAPTLLLAPILVADRFHCRCRRCWPFPPNGRQQPPELSKRHHGHSRIRRCQSLNHDVPRTDDRADFVSETRSEEHTSELQSLMRHSYAVFCLKKKQLLPTKQRVCSQPTIKL